MSWWRMFFWIPRLLRPRWSSHGVLTARAKLRHSRPRALQLSMHSPAPCGPVLTTCRASVSCCEPALEIGAHGEHFGWQSGSRPRPPRLHLELPLMYWILILVLSLAPSSLSCFGSVFGSRFVSFSSVFVPSGPVSPRSCPFRSFRSFPRPSSRFFPSFSFFPLHPLGLVSRDLDVLGHPLC